MYAVEFLERAHRQLVKVARKDPDQAGSIAKKIRWLGENAEHIQHEKMQSNPECSLHVGAYRVLYLVDHSEEAVVVVDVDRHDAAYRRLGRRR